MGLYLNPPENALVLSVDEKSQKRALNGTVLAECKPRHRHQKFLAFLRSIEASVPARLDIHLIVDKLQHPQARCNDSVYELTGRHTSTSVS